MRDIKEVRTTRHEAGQEQRFATFKATQVIWLVLTLVESLLALRVVFKLVGVNPANSFATLLYNVTDFFVAPFASLTGTPASGGMVLEISTLIAMFVYLLIAWGLERIVYVVFYRDRGPVSVKQTTVADRAALEAPVGVSQVTTDRITTEQPGDVVETTVSEQTTSQ